MFSWCNHNMGCKLGNILGYVNQPFDLSRTVPLRLFSLFLFLLWSCYVFLLFLQFNTLRQILVSMYVCDIMQICTLYLKVLTFITCIYISCNLWHINTDWWIRGSEALHIIIHIWANAWQNQQYECASSEDSGQLGIHPVWSESSLGAQRVA